MESQAFVVKEKNTALDKDGSCTLESVTAKNIEVLSGGQNSIHIRNSKSVTMNTWNLNSKKA